MCMGIYMYLRSDDCMVYMEEHDGLVQCEHCKANRYHETEAEEKSEVEEENLSSDARRRKKKSAGVKIAAKKYFYFPLVQHNMHTICHFLVHHMDMKYRSH